jgi:2-iminobutanoate/2-iminopropanoate deaminase
MTGRRLVATENAPKAIGPYSQAVVGAGLVHCSGQIALDPKSGELVAGDVRAQTERVLKNLEAVLSAAGSSLAQVQKCNVFLIDMADFPAMNEVYGRFFQAANAPARATVAVAGLPRGARVEIDCVALV